MNQYLKRALLLSYLLIAMGITVSLLSPIVGDRSTALTGMDIVATGILLLGVTNLARYVKDEPEQQPNKGDF